MLSGRGYGLKLDDVTGAPPEASIPFGLARDGEPVFRRVPQSNLRDRLQEAAQFIAVAAPMLDELIASK